MHVFQFNTLILNCNRKGGFMDRITNVPGIRKNILFWLVAFMLVVSLTSCEDLLTNQEEEDEESNGGQNTELSSSIDSDTRLENVFDDPTKADYVINGTVNVHAKLTIDPGVRIETEAGSRLDVESEGALVASGTASNPIVITGKVQTAGHWEGLNIVSNNTVNELNYVHIGYGGQDGWSNVYVQSSGQIQVKNSRLHNSKTYGLHAEANAGLPQFTSNTFSQNISAALRIPSHLVGALDAASDYADNNTNNYIEVSSYNVENDQSWPATNAPYLFNGTTNILAEVTIQAGAEFHFASEARVDIETDGVLRAMGTATDSVIIRGEVATPGYWEGIVFRSNNPLNELNYTSVAHGGLDGYSNVYVDGNGQAKFAHCTFKESATHGMIAETNTNFAAFTENTFLRNQQSALRIPARLIAAVDGASTYMGGNNDNYISVNRSGINQSGTWPATDAPFRFGGTTDIHSDITVEAGAQFLFAQGARIDVESDGSFKAVGTTTDKITFLGEVATKGYWEGINFISNNPLNELTHTEVAHGGSDGWANVWVQSSGQLTLTESYIHHSSGWGVYVENNATTTINNNTFSENDSGDVGP